MLVALVGGVVLSGASLAVADTGTQNPDLTVGRSLESSGEYADRATAGDTITTSWLLTNNTAKFQIVRVTGSLTGPAGNTVTRSRLMILAPMRTYSISFSYVVPAFFQLGSYTRTFAAANANGESSTSASMEIY